MGGLHTRHHGAWGWSAAMWPPQCLLTASRGWCTHAILTLLRGERGFSLFPGTGGSGLWLRASPSRGVSGEESRWLQKGPEKSWLFPVWRFITVCPSHMLWVS